MMKILLVDDHALVRDGIRRILENEQRTIFGEASNAPEVLQTVREQDWDLVILDLSLKGRDGLEVLAEIRKIQPRLPVLILSMYSEGLFAVRALRAGAAGYLTKNCGRSELIHAVEKLTRGEVYVSPALPNDLIVELRHRKVSPPHEALSNREFEILRSIGGGKTVTEIAQRLRLSVGTISTYRARILRKMGMRTNSELTRYAFRHRLVE